MTVVNSTNNIAFTGDRTKKTPRGNEYKVTHFARTTGTGVGLLSGALVAHMASKGSKTISGKKMFIQSLKNMGKDLNALGPSGTRKGFVAKGIAILTAGIAITGMFVGAAIGGTIDSHNNHNRAKEADRTTNV